MRLHKEVIITDEIAEAMRDFIYVWETYGQEAPVMTVFQTLVPWFTDIINSNAKLYRYRYKT